MKFALKFGVNRAQVQFTLVLCVVSLACMMALNPNPPPWPDNQTRDLAPKANVLRCHHRHTPQCNEGGGTFHGGVAYPWGGVWLWSLLGWWLAGGWHPWGGGQLNQRSCCLRNHWSSNTISRLFQKQRSNECTEAKWADNNTFFGRATEVMFVSSLWRWCWFPLLSAKAPCAMTKQWVLWAGVPLAPKLSKSCPLTRNTFRCGCIGAKIEWAPLRVMGQVCGALFHRFESSCIPKLGTLTCRQIP